jgi:CheY-like chemotaxis protein
MSMTKKILVVEDLTDIRKMMKIMVELYGYEVIEARDGAEAVEQAREHRPSLVLMDLAMPLMNGADAARAIKGTASCEDIPIIAVTAYQNMDEEALDAGCERVIHKPVDFLKLKTLLAEHAV